MISFVCNSDVSLTEDQYALYGHKTGRIPRGANQIYDPTRWAPSEIECYLVISALI